MKKLHNKKSMPLPFAKIDLKMKLTAIFVFATFFSMLASNKGYTQTITLEEENTAIIEVINKIEVSTKYRFVYNTKFVDLQRKVSINLKDASIEKVLTHLFDDTNTAYQISRETQIILKHKKVEKSSHNTANNKQSTTLQNQQVIINGTVIDETGQPLPGANIKVKGTNLGTTTDFDGNFSLEIPSSESIIVVSYIGYTTQEVSYDGQKSLSISLAPSAASLDEVVVIGYGSVAKKDLTGSVATVDNIGERPVTTTEEGLQGSVSGVTVVSNGGDPTATPTIRIRGAGTFNSEAPLYVVDGVPYFGGPINPFDIETMAILKDASSQAIYGVRASGGVILITTKKGKKGKMSFDFNHFTGFSNAEKPKALSTSQALALGQLNPLSPELAAEYAHAGGRETNWIDEVFRTGISQNYDIGVRGGSENLTFSSSLGYNKKEGVLINTQAERLTFRINTSFKVNDKLTIGENISYTRTEGNSAFTGTSDENGTQNYDGIIAAAIKSDRRTPVYTEDGAYSNLPSTTTINTVSTLNRLDIENITQDLFANIYVDYEILDGLKFKSSFGINSKTNDFNEFTPKSPEVSGGQSRNNSLDYATSEQTDWSLETTINYSTTINDAHKLTLLAGHTLQRSEVNEYSITGRTFPFETESTRELINATEWTKPFTKYGANSLVSYFGRAIYDYNRKYLLTVSARRDESSKLSKENRASVFPAVAVGWNIKEENFLKDNDNISNLKLRASWGVLGNINALGNYPTRPQLSVVQVVLGENSDRVNGLAADTRANLDINWELTESYNLGFDLGFFDGSLKLTADYFIKDTKDLIFELPVSSLEGISQEPFINSGEVRNEGFEVNLSYQGGGEKKDDFKYTISGNISKIQNELVSLNKGSQIFHTNNIASLTPLRSVEGQPLFSFYAYETDGIFQSNASATAYTPQPTAVAGDLKIKDVNGDGIINEEDQTFQGTALPDLTYSLNMDFNYKNFDLRIFLQGVSGSKGFNGYKYTTVYPGQTSVADEANLSIDALDTWSPTNTGASNFRLDGFGGLNEAASDFWIEDTSYLRLKNVTLGYTFPKVNGFSRLRIYAAAENLFTITNYSGLDPEIGLNNNGLDGGQYPISKTITLGLNLAF